MAAEFGKVCVERRAGRAPAWRLEFWVSGRRYRIRHVPLPGGGRLPLRDEPIALATLEAIRGAIRDGKTPLQALAPYIAGPETLFRHHWRRFVEAKRRQGEGGRQLSARRVYELGRLEPRGYLDALLEVPVLTLTHGQLEDWVRALFDRNLAPKTVRNAVTDVGACLHWLARRGDLPATPELPAVHLPEYVPTIPTPAELDAILAAIPDELRGLFLARGRMGLRPSEAARANVADWHFETHELTVIGKGGLARVLPSHPEVADWIGQHRAAAFPLEPLFPNPRAHNPERRWVDTTARNVLFRAMDEAGTPQFKPNEATRHAFATHHIGRVGKDLLSPYLGHRDAKTTDRYARIDTSKLRPVVEREDEK